MGGACFRRRGVSSALIAAAVLLVAATVANAAPTRACPSPGASSARCVRVEVPLDRSGALPGTVGLRVRILPPRAGDPGETVLALAGGPGQAAAPLLPLFRLSLPGALLRSRRLVAFDQRGTGRSGRLRCPGLGRALEARDRSVEALVRAVEACAERLGPARAHYTTTDSVEDVEAVRAALGVDRLVLYGTSYGTKVALDYAAAYPQHVSRLLLDSTMLPEGVDPFERTTIASIPRVMRAVCANRGCRFTRDAGADLVALAERLAARPLSGRLVDGRGRSRRAAVSQLDLLRLLLESDVDVFGRTLLPAAIRAARDGDPALLVRLAAIPAVNLDVEGADSSAVLVATRCEDGGVPWPAGTPIAQRQAAVGAALSALPPGAFGPFSPATVRDTGIPDLCDAWPESPIAQPRPPLPDVPALILSGDVDLRTPRSYALELARRMPRAHVVTVPRSGHSVLGSDATGCATAAVKAFFAGRAPRPCGRSPRELSFLAPADVPARRLGDLRPQRGYAGRVGRTLTAVRATTDYVARTLVVELLPQLLNGGPRKQVYRFGGLRGGSLAFSRRVIVFRRYSVVPGVTLSARTSNDGDYDAPLAVRIGGTAAAHGALRIGDRWIVGRLAGRRVRVRVPQEERSGGLIARAARTASPGESPERVLSELPPALRTLLGLD